MKNAQSPLIPADLSNCSALTAAPLKDFLPPSSDTFHSWPEAFANTGAVNPAVRNALTARSYERDQNSPSVY